ncbi:DNA photolyase FAD-binding/Cryptochrome [Macrophomina phaseolina MS6]|uniref:DNA photolyase FAD-binding/Cryptochrome n=1 Tax=Macrophomina phaseolina (strain MS6) TaxID=1126212 RepID=K2RRG5_MACPH|nr:DNA photolyase FAD-binding/Cryptochrome [Macrophomina phaseolina MS6]
MWLSCTAFFAQFYRCYSPIAFPQKWDKEGEFVRRWVPELKDFDKKYIYEPWKAPIADQKKWGCMVRAYDEMEEAGSKWKKEANTEMKSYPKPIFDFNERRKICIDALKHAYDVGLYGNDPRVLDGSWKELFPDAAEGATEGTGGDLLNQHGRGESAPGDGEDYKSRAKKSTVGGKEAVARKRRSSRGGQGTLDGMVKKSRRK